MTLPPPLANGRYQLQELLGEGGMASVYVAHDQVLDVHRAIKMLTPRLCANQRVRQRFIDEARAMARMRHGNIVTVHDVGIDGEQPYIIMELVLGGSVGDLVEVDGAQSPAVAGAVMIGMLHGLQCAHDSGVVHRDIKPDNILLTRGGIAKITDFGIAQIESTNHGMTRTGAMLGTIAYMAPEQRRDSKSVTLKSDLYAAGATLFALLKGTEPFDLYAKELQDALLTNIPGPFAEVIKKACSFNPDDRYGSALAMAEAIQVALDEMGVALKTDGSADLPESFRQMGGGWNADSVVGSRRVSAETSDFSQTSMDLMLGQNSTGSSERVTPSFPLMRWLGLAFVVSVAGGGVWFALQPPAPTCGDGIVNVEEQCDDGNDISTDTCTNACDLNVVFLHGSPPDDNNTWLLGRTEAYDDRDISLTELPATPVMVHPFWLDRHEVTRQAYRSWAQSQGGDQQQVLKVWDRDRHNAPDLPANNVTHRQAREYCQHLGGDTPTEAHWEYAARSGARDIEYPWGDEEPTCELAILGRSDCSAGRPHPVCSRPKGNSQQGLCDLAGNVWEWTRTLFPDAEGKDFPPYAGPPDEAKGFEIPEREVERGYWEIGLAPVMLNDRQSEVHDVIRGGGYWMTVAYFNRARARFFLPKGKKEANVGFRCMYPGTRFNIP